MAVRPGIQWTRPFKSVGAAFSQFSHDASPNSGGHSILSAVIQEWLLGECPKESPWGTRFARCRSPSLVAGMRGTCREH